MTSKRRCRCGRDEELGSVCSLPPTLSGIGHGKQERLLERELGVNLVIELVTGASRTRSERVTTLNHEAWNHTVEDHVGIQRGALWLSSAGVSPFNVTGG